MATKAASRLRNLPPNGLRKIYISVLTFFKNVYHRAVLRVEKKPVGSFVILLEILFLLIVFGNIIRQPAPQPPKKTEPKTVEVYKIGTAPKMMLQAQIEKSSVIKIVAQTSGVVQKINAKEGDRVNRGQSLISLSSNYQGGNSFVLSRQLAEKQNQLTEESYPISKDLITKQRDIANQTLDNFEELRDITSKSVDETQNLINLNNNIISSLDTTINSLESDISTATTSASVILGSKQMKSQFQSANLQLNNQLKNANYQTDEDKPPTQLTQLQKDIALKQLDFQDKALDLNREISKLQLEIARVNEALMYPAAPITAQIDKIYVRVGQTVNPGTLLLSLSGVNNRNIQAVVYLPREIAMNISQLEDTVFFFGNKKVNLKPSYITQDTVQGNLYAAVYNLPDDNYDAATDKGFISALVPIGYANTSATIPYIPLDAVYQTQDEAYVFVAVSGKANSKKITLGDVFGSFVQVTSGLGSGDAVIINRNVIENDSVITK